MYRFFVTSLKSTRAIQTAMQSRWLNVSKILTNPIQVKMPSLSPTMEDGSIAQWNKKEGDPVSAGDVLCEVQTDKAVVALESEEDGIVAKIIVAEKVPNIKVGDLIAVLATPDEDWKEVAASAAAIAPSVAKQPKSEVSAPVAQETHPSEAPSSAAPGAQGVSRVGPAVRLLLQSHGLSESAIPASGPHGTLLKSDVMSYLSTHPAATEKPPSVDQTSTFAPLPSVQTSFTDIPLTTMRMTIAKRLTQSKSSIPHAFVRSVASIDKVMDLRKQLKDRAGLKLSVNDFVTKACALGLRLVPELNAIADSATGACHLQTDVDICMAVATPAGLITPILHHTDQTPISQLSLMARNLAKKARNGKLQPQEFQGGTFTISNLGMFGIREFTAIINPPQVAILAVGSGLPKAVGTAMDTPDRVLFANQMSMTLSVDSRFVDEATAGRFLAQVNRLLSEHPELLLADDPTVKAALQMKDSSTNDDFDMLVLSLSTEPTLRVAPVS